MNGICTGPVWLIVDAVGRGLRGEPVAQPLPGALHRAPPRPRRASASIVAIEAAIATAENQNEPVTKICWAPSRKRSLPVTAASA